MRGTSYLECKHKHMMKSGAPPDKVGVLQPLLPIEFHGFTSRIDFFCSWSYLNFFIDGMGPFTENLKKTSKIMLTYQLCITLQYIVSVYV